MTTDYRALCVELTDCLEKADWPHRYKAVFQQWVYIARAALAEPDGPAVPDGREPASVAMQPSEPEAEGPTDEELLRVAANALGYLSTPPWDFEAALLTADDVLTIASAVLARLGRPAAAPVPGPGEVAELVAALEADAECAEAEHYDLCNMTADQMRRAATLLQQQAANALPLPAPEGGEVSQ